ncbi:hypothetical protein [Streptomyces niger]|uniref:hypothetical protein n=1 Tax=Streptomyces niger TaxID=66373 RepID=UPI000A71CE34|nr:hypothetical protein [Streptomyces niger]
MSEPRRGARAGGRSRYEHLGVEGTRRLTELAGTTLSKVVLTGGGLPLRDIGKR